MEHLTPTPNDSLLHAAAGNLAFLLSIIRCGEQLSEEEEQSVRKLITELESADKPENLHCNMCLTKDTRWTYVLGAKCPNPNCDGVVEREPEWSELVDVLPEPMTCKRRMQAAGPWEYKEGLDRWHKFKSNGQRVCSFCGSLHFDDFAALVKMAAEGSAVGIHPSDKPYKVYVDQPSVRNAREGGLKFYMQHLPRDADGKVSVTPGQNVEYAEAVKQSAERFAKLTARPEMLATEINAAAQPDE